MSSRAKFRIVGRSKGAKCLKEDMTAMYLFRCLGVHLRSSSHASIEIAGLWKTTFDGPLQPAERDLDYGKYRPREEGLVVHRRGVGQD